MRCNCKANNARLSCQVSTAKTQFSNCLEVRLGHRLVALRPNASADLNTVLDLDAAKEEVGEEHFEKEEEHGLGDC